MKELVIIGAGGLGIEALWAANDMGGWKCRGFVDDNSSKGPVFSGLPLLGTVSEVAASDSGGWFHCAIGKNDVRQRVSEEFQAAGWRSATLIHPSVLIAPGVEIGPGSYIGPGSILCPNAKLGLGVVINCHVSVGHDSLLGDFVQACPGVRVSGNCTVGELSFLGSNASLKPGVRIGQRVSVGANSFVINSVSDGRAVFGVPAKPIQL